MELRIVLGWAIAEQSPIRIAQETNGLDVGVEAYADEPCDVGEGPSSWASAVHAVAHDLEPQVSDEGAPDLELDGVATVAQEVAQRVVLLDALE